MRLSTPADVATEAYAGIISCPSDRVPSFGKAELSVVGDADGEVLSTVAAVVGFASVEGD